MSNKALIPAGPVGDKPINANGLEDFIHFYKQALYGHYKEVTDGEDMLQLGAKTSIIQMMETFLKNPMEAVISTHDQMEVTLRQAVESLFAITFKHFNERNIVKSAFKISCIGNSLSYGVILQKDTFKNRNEVLKFLSAYDTFEFANKIRANIQFVPEKLISKFNKVEYIS
jgi:hypothetical protein